MLYIYKYEHKISTIRIFTVSQNTFDHKRIQRHSHKKQKTQTVYLWQQAVLIKGVRLFVFFPSDWTTRPSKRNTSISFNYRVVSYRKRTPKYSPICFPKNCQLFLSVTKGRCFSLIYEISSNTTFLSKIIQSEARSDFLIFR